MRCINARTASPADGLGLGLGLGLGVAHRLTSALFWSSRNLKRIVFVLSCGRGASRSRSQTPRVRLVCRGWRQSPHLICQQAEQECPLCGCGIPRRNVHRPTIGAAGWLGTSCNNIRCSGGGGGGGSSSRWSNTSSISGCSHRRFASTLKVCPGSGLVPQTHPVEVNLDVVRETRCLNVLQLLHGESHHWRAGDGDACGPQDQGGENNIIAY